MGIQVKNDHSPAQVRSKHALKEFDDTGRHAAWETIARRGVSKKQAFLLFVVIPSLIVALYYGFIASDQFVAEARMVVRTIGVSEKLASTEDRDGRAIIGGDSLTQDSYIVASYLASTAIVQVLEKEIGLRALFQRNDIDYFSRLSGDVPIEELHTYWLKHVETYVDGPSGIIIFRVRAFSPQDALLIIKAAIAASARIIDEISEQAKRDLVKRSQNELEGRVAELNTVLLELRNYQNQTGILDPTLRATEKSTLMASLVQRRLETALRLSVVEASGVKDSANVQQLKQLQKSLDQQIAAVEKELTGDGNQQSIANYFTEFAKLETKRLVAQTLYRAAERNLDVAKSTALRRTTFLSLFAEPALPSESTVPKRWSSWFLYFLAFLSLWTIATLIWMSVEDHRA